MREKIIYGLGVIAAVLLARNLYSIFMQLPDEASQGMIYRIIFFHVPAAITAMLCSAVACVASVMFLVTRNFKHDAIAVATTEVGLAFLAANLVTGSIWGRPAWGVWWTWDARLTTTLMLWLIYVSYLLLRRFAAGPQMQTLAAVLAVFGALDMPFNYLANRLWRTQHPSPVFFAGDNGSMESHMLAAFGWNVLAWAVWGLSVLAVRVYVERRQQAISMAEAAAALAGV